MEFDLSVVSVSLTCILLFQALHITESQQRPCQVPVHGPADIRRGVCGLPHSGNSHHGERDGGERERGSCFDWWWDYHWWYICCILHSGRDLPHWLLVRALSTCTLGQGVQVGVEMELLFDWFCLFSFTEGAGENCLKCCSKAIELSPSNPEAHQLLASCLLSQGKQDEAKVSLMRGVSLWLPSKVGGASSSSSEEASNDITSTESSFPPYFSRINTAKLLLEVHEYDVSNIQDIHHGWKSGNFRFIVDGSYES